MPEALRSASTGVTCPAPATPSIPLTGVTAVLRVESAQVNRERE